MRTIITIGALIVVISAGILAVSRRKGKMLSGDEGGADNGKGPSPADFKKGCFDELNQVARDFGFLYERTYLFVNGGSLDEDASHLFQDWDNKIRIYSISYLKQTWESILARMSSENDQQEIKTALTKWLDFLQAMGVKRGEETEIVIRDNNIHHIYFIDEISKIGDVLIITKPAWFFDGKFVEKGIGVVKKDNTTV